MRIASATRSTVASKWFTLCVRCKYSEPRYACMPRHRRFTQGFPASVRLSVSLENRIPTLNKNISRPPLGHDVSRTSLNSFTRRGSIVERMDIFFLSLSLKVRTTRNGKRIRLFAGVVEKSRTSVGREALNKKHFATGRDHRGDCSR